MKIDINSESYPENLKRIDKPPKSINAKGNISLLKTSGIAIVGSRKCTEYGKRITRKFSKELSLYGLTIISGMAIGIDTFAHEGCLEVKGNTIAVLPSGFNKIYPRENIKLYNNILENNGLIITEYDENEEASSKNFLERNKIVSGLAIGTLVIEGGFRSGASVTAKITKNQGKKVFCIPSDIESTKGITPNRLIKEGANLVTEVNDIIKKYPELKLEKRDISEKKANIKFISKEFKAIYDILDSKESMHINEIAKKVKLNIEDVSYKLMMLELDDKIVALPGNNYKKNEIL